METAGGSFTVPGWSDDDLDDNDLSEQLAAIIDQDDGPAFDADVHSDKIPETIQTSSQTPHRADRHEPPRKRTTTFSNAMDTISLNASTGLATHSDGSSANASESTLTGRRMSDVDSGVDARGLVAHEAAGGAEPTSHDAGGAAAGDYDHTPDRLETVAHAMLLFIALGVVLAFSHWNYIQVVMSSGALMLVSMVMLYNLFMRRREHRAVQTLLVIWVLWLLYGVLVFGYQYTIDSAWLYGLRDVFITVQIVLLVAFRMMPAQITESEYGAQMVSRVVGTIGQQRMSAVENTLYAVRDTVTEHIPRRLDSLTDGASVRAGRHLQHDCMSTVHDFRNNAGVRFISCDSRIGFIMYQLLLTLPFAENNPVAYNPYWTAARLTLSWVLYKLVDDIYRPRMPNTAPSPSAPTVVTVSQFVLYADPYLAIVVGVVLVVILSYVCKRVREQRSMIARASMTDCELGAFEDPPPLERRSD